MASPSIGPKEYYLQLINTRTKRPVDDDTGVFQVYTVGSPTRATIYDAAGVRLTQSVQFGNFVSRTMTDGKISFYAAASVTSVDISVLTAGGRSYFLKGVTPSQHRVDVDPEQTEFTLVVGTNDSASSTAQRQLGFQAKKGMIIHDVFVKVTTAFVGAATASNRLNIGVAGSSSGLAKLFDVSATGYHGIKVHSTTGKMFATQFAGTLLADWQTATNATAPGWFTRKPYFVPTATQLTVARAAALTASMTGTNARGKGYIYFVYRLDPTAIASN